MLFLAFRESCLWLIDVRDCCVCCLQLHGHISAIAQAQGQKERSAKKQYRIYRLPLLQHSACGVWSGVVFWLCEGKRQGQQRRRTLLQSYCLVFFSKTVDLVIYIMLIRIHWARSLHSQMEAFLHTWYICIFVGFILFLQKNRSQWVYLLIEWSVFVLCGEWTTPD